ncbi:MAG TPA: MASE1 domain-containing protein [Candidatus Acidoferrum sp.]|nr:MASE1 domain-containing protein [Candidatus Acidoferrum sp.]
MAALCYIAGRLGGALIVQPQMVSPLWLGNVILASVLVLVRRRLWPVFLLAGLAGFVLYDLQGGAPAHAIVWLFLSNAVEVLTAAWCLRYAFDGAPRLNSVKALAKYSFYAVFLAPFVGAFLGALSNSSNYWATWKVAFFSEALGFLTLMPAILGWAREIPLGAKKPLAHYIEAVVLLVALVVLGQLAFASPLGSTLPTLLYSLVPLLLWCTLRFGSTGVSTSMIAIAFVAIWGAIHGRGPFTGPELLIDVPSLQLFLFFTAAPFMALAALVEETNDAEQALRQRDTELNEAQRMAQTGSWRWDPRTDAMTWSAELYRMAGYNPKLPAPSFKDHEQFFTPESWDRLQQGVEKALRTGIPYELDLEATSLNGTKLWLTSRGEAVVDASGHPIYLRGTTQDITQRKLSEEALMAMSGRLITAQEAERTRIARELHDDLSQRMAVLQISVEQFKQGMPDISSKAKQQLHTIAETAREVSSDIHSLSYQLHPARLELLGLVASLKGFCGEFSAQHKIDVQFLHSNIPGQIPKDVSLCLYRITQEALQNVVKHSEAAEAEVELSGQSEEIELCISDSGRGFDVESAKRAAGLGLVSMRERLRLVGGHLSVESEPSRGTRICVRVPQAAIAAAVAIRT